MSEVESVEPTDAFDNAQVLACVPAPAEWIEQVIGDDVDVEEAAHKWLGTVAAIGATASSVMWISPSRISDDSAVDVIVSWLDDEISRSMLTAPQVEDSVLSISSGPALSLARFAYETLQSDPVGFKPLALLIHAATIDSVVASRLSWYLGPPDVGSDVIGSLEERLTGAEASYDVLRSRRSVKIALSVAAVAERLSHKHRRPRS